jgi:hypothetical protein
MPTVTSAVLSVVTSYDSGTGNTGDQRPTAVVSLNDLRLYDLESLGALSLLTAYEKFNLSAATGEPVSWPTKDAYAKCVYTLPLLPPPTAAEWNFPPWTWTPDSTSTKLAYDPSSLATLLETLTLSLFIYSSARVFTGSTDGLGTASLKVYAAYIDVTFSDTTTARYWAPNQTVLPGGAWAGGSNPAAPAPGTPSDVLDAASAIDGDNTTYATVRATSKIVSPLSSGPLWNAPKLVLDWSLSVDCDDPPSATVGLPYSHSFTARGGTGSYSWSIASGELPPGLALSADGTVSGIPTDPGAYSFTIAVADADAPAVTATCSIEIVVATSGTNTGGGVGGCVWLDLWVWQPLIAFASLDQEIALPPAYQRALRYQLATEMAGRYRRDPKNVAALAAEAIATVDALNISNAQAAEDPIPPPQ